jgi:hypothetical protein
MIDKKNKQLHNALNDCLEKLIIKGETLESCLTSYSEQADELRLLLQTALASREASSIHPNADFRARARYEFRSALYEAAVREKARPSFSWRWRLATVISAVMVLLLVSAGGVMAASTTSMPGQALYQVKLTVEQIQLTLTPSVPAKARLYARLADHRVIEIMYTAQKGDAQLTEQLTRQFEKDLSMALNLGATTDNRGDFGVMQTSPSKALGGNTAENTTPPTLVVTAPAPTTTLILPPDTQIVAAKVNIADEKLLKLLQQYAAKYPKALTAILDTIPEAAKPAFLQAMAVITAGYQQIPGAPNP